MLYVLYFGWKKLQKIIIINNEKFMWIQQIHVDYKKSINSFEMKKKR